MKQLIWSRLARQDLYRIAFDEMLFDAETLIERIEKAPLILLEFPEIGELIWPDGRRKWRIKATPFLLIYKAHEGKVEISRVTHVASDWETIA
jgi:toxin ParE1/3/4